MKKKFNYLHKNSFIIQIPLKIILFFQFLIKLFKRKLKF